MVILQIILAVVSLAFLLFVPGYLASAATGLTDFCRGVGPSSAGAGAVTTGREADKLGALSVGMDSGNGSGGDLSLLLLLSVLVSVLISSWWGLVEAELGLLSQPVHLAGLVCLSAVLAWLAARRGTLSFRLPAIGRWDLALAGVAVIAILLFWPPGQPAFGNTDAGAHFSSGVNLGRTGGFLISDPALRTALENPDTDRPPLGLENVDDPRGLFVAQFSGLYEVWVALGYQVFGWWTPADTLQSLWDIGRLRHPITIPLPFYVTPLFGLLSVVATYACGMVVYSRKVGLVAALLLAVAMPQVWYSRLASSEVLAQFLILCGITAYALSLKAHRRPFLFIAGSAFGLALLVRIDAVFVYVPMGLLLLYLIVSRRWQTDHAFLFGPLVVLALHSFVHYVLMSGSYIGTTVDGLLKAYGNLVAPSLALAAFVLLAILYLRLNRDVSERIAALVRILAPRAPLLLAVLIGLISAYAYFIRPLQAAPVALYHPLLEEVVVYDETANLVKLGWYLTPLGIALGIGGMMWTSARRLSSRTWLLLALGAVYGLIFVYSAFITPHHVFWVRRYLIVFIPALLLFAAAVLQGFGEERWSGRGCAAARLVACGVLLALLASVTPRAIAAPQYQEATQQLRALAAMLPDRSVAVFEGSEATKWLGLPLTLVYGRTVVTLQRDSPDNDRFDRMLAKWWEEGRKTYYVSQIGTKTIDDAAVEFQPVGRISFAFLQLEMALGRLPEEHQQVTFAVDVYRMVPRIDRDLPVTGYPFELKVGEMDYGYIGRGFYPSEGLPSRTYRHTDGEGEVWLPWKPSGREVVMTVTAASTRPPDVPEPAVSVYVEGLRVGDFTLPNASTEQDPFVKREIRLSTDVVRPAGGKVLVRLVSDTWTPAEHGLGDARVMGITTARIELRDVR